MFPKASQGLSYLLRDKNVSYNVYPPHSMFVASTLTSGAHVSIVPYALHWLKLTLSLKNKQQCTAHDKMWAAGVLKLQTKVPSSNSGR
jgi:hypothetical protein